MTAPVRLQRDRRKGSNLQALSMATNGLPAVNVTRLTRWGNRYVIRPSLPHGTILRPNLISVPSAAIAVARFRADLERWLEPDVPEDVRPIGYEDLAELRGKNVACWCNLCADHKNGKPLGIVCDQCKPCHGDVLLELANGPAP